jgi:hypothetical protein
MKQKGNIKIINISANTPNDTSEKSKVSLGQFSENYAKNFPADFIQNLNN